MVLSYAYCNVSVAPLHLEPAHRSEQTSQLLFGEKLEILEISTDEWARIRGRWDDYEGWCRLSQLQLISLKEYRKPVRNISFGHYDKLVAAEGELWTPAGSELTGIKNTHLFHAGKTGKFKGKKQNIDKKTATAAEIVSAARTFLNAPYQWGGRTIAGIDCSGLVQMACKMAGLSIVRDASQQALVGNTLDFLPEAAAGDLAFFDNAEGKIVHVGILLDAQTIIHATDTSGRVVIDKLDNGGIISVSLKKRTHNLRVVKKILINN